MGTGSITTTDQTSGAEVATRTVSEDSQTKHIQRVQQDGRLNSPAKRYLITLALTGAAAGTNLGGLRKANANPDVYIHRIKVTQYQAAASTASAPLFLRRAITVAGGTQVTAADIPKLDSAAGNATLEVRTGAVTGTEAAQRMLAFMGSPTQAAGGGAGPDEFDSGNDIARAIRLTGDEGLIFENELASDTDIRYLVTIEWEEA